MRLATLILFALVASSSVGQDILLITDRGYFILPVTDGIPGGAVPLADWWTGDIVDQRTDGGGDTKADPIADQVATWADAEPQEYRQQFVDAWAEVVAQVTAGQMTAEFARTKGIVQKHREILALVENGAWTLWCERVAELVDQEVRRGRYSVDTLKSVMEGLKK